MNRKELEAFTCEAAKSINTEKDLNAFSQMLTKITVETALNAELDDQLGYASIRTLPQIGQMNDIFFDKPVLP